MIWLTYRGRWLARHGHWHPWFAWRPVSLEPPAEAEHAEPLSRAWLCIVWRIGVLVRGERFWLYQPVGEGTPQQAIRPGERPRLRVVK